MRGPIWDMYEQQRGRAENAEASFRGLQEVFTQVVTQRNTLIKLLREAENEGYIQHSAWRCDHPDRYPHDPDCPCLLTDWLRRVNLARKEMGEGGIGQATEGGTDA